MHMRTSYIFCKNFHSVHCGCAFHDGYVFCLVCCALERCGSILLQELSPGPLCDPAPPPVLPKPLDPPSLTAVVPLYGTPYSSSLCLLHILFFLIVQIYFSVPLKDVYGLYLFP